MVATGLLEYKTRRDKRRKRNYVASVLAILIVCYRRGKRVYYVILS